MGSISFLHEQPRSFRPTSEKFKKYGFIPTNFLKWRQYNLPKVGAIVSSIILIILTLIFLFGIISYLAPHIYLNEEFISCWYVEDPFVGFIRFSESDRAGALLEYYFVLRLVLIVLVIGITIFLIILILCKKRIPQRVINPTPINDFADYVQKRYYGHVYSFFLKDGKMGLLNSKTLAAQLNPIYDKLKWRERNSFLEAEKDGTVFVIDINGNILK